MTNNQNPIKSHNPLLDADGSGKLLPESGSESKHAKTLAEKLVSLEAENKRLRESLQLVLETRFTTYKAKNGKQVGLKDDNGELCYIIPSDSIQKVEQALSAQTPTTGILELAAAAVKWANIELNDVSGLEKAETSLSKAYEALSPEVKAMLEGLSGD